MKLAVFFVGLLALAACGEKDEPQADIPLPVHEPPPPKEWRLVWADEFDYTGRPEPGRWDYDLGGGGWGNNELQFYTAAEKNVRVENGHLIIEAHRESIGNRNYTSARLVSRNRGDWTYARVEARAKLPGGRGTWAAIWMLPTDFVYGPWPRSGEIDIMEHVGYDEGRVHATVHTDAFNHIKRTQQGASMMVPDATNAFHVYAVEWTARDVVFKINDQTYFTFRNSGGIAYWPFDQRFHLLFNIAIGGSWGGLRGVDDAAFPMRMEVDYVRVYQ